MKKLDLHGIKHDEVPNMVKRFIEDHWTDYGEQLEIITGHSPRMRLIAGTVLLDYKLKYVVKQASLIVEI